MDLAGLGWIGIDLSGFGDPSSLSGCLGHIAQNDTKTSNLEPLNDTLRGFAALQAFKRHLSKALGLTGL